MGFFGPGQFAGGGFFGGQSSEADKDKDKEKKKQDKEHKHETKSTEDS
jgi:hypothetical protein